MITNTHIPTRVSDLLPHPDAVQAPPPGVGSFLAIEVPSLPPEGYSVAVLADGCYYPQRLDQSTTAVQFIPLVTDPVVSLKFSTSLAAIAYCWEEVLGEVKYEGGIERVMHWQASSPYSDRVEEYQQLLEAWTGERALFWTANGFAIAAVGPFLWSPCPFFLNVVQETIEEALSALCEQVYALAHPLVEHAQEKEWKTWWEESHALAR